MNESTVVDALTKLGVAGLLGLLLWHVLVKVGDRLVAAIDTLAAEVRENTKATAEVKVMLQEAAAARVREAAAADGRRRRAHDPLNDTQEDR